MSIYYKYSPDGTKIVVLSYVDDYVYWYTSEALLKRFVDTPGKIIHLNFLGYVHWFTSIRIYQMKYHTIYAHQDMYSTSIVCFFLFFDTVTVKTSTEFYNNTLTSNMIFIKADEYTSDYQVDKLTMEFNIN